jgi:hypothetical protein
MDLDQLLRTEAACEKESRHKVWLSIHVVGYPVRESRARKHLRDCAEREHRRTIREKRLPQRAPDHANCSRTMGK